jgi:hypothetical protein
MKVQIDLGCKWEFGKLTYNELAYRVDELLPDIYIQVLEQLTQEYQSQLIKYLQSAENSTQEQPDIGRHEDKGKSGESCRCRRVKRKGFRWYGRHIKGKYGTAEIRLQMVECLGCGKRFAPLLDALKIEPYTGHDDVLEKAVIDAVIDTNYRRLVNGHSLDVSLGGIHNFVAGSDIDELLAGKLDLDNYRAIMADGSGLKKSGGKKGELRVLVGITTSGDLEPIGSWVDTPWDKIEQQTRERIKEDPKELPLFVYDGEPGLEDFLAGSVRAPQRCTWHGSRGLYYAMWQDGHRKKKIKHYQDSLAKIIAVEIPEGDYERLAPEAIEDVRSKYREARKSMDELIDNLQQNKCSHAVEYLKNLVRGLYHQIDMWLATGIIAPKTTSRLERLFRELARRLKRIAWGWSDKVATNLSKMIMIKQYSPEVWKEYWLKKLGIQGSFKIWVQSITVPSGINI